MQRAARLAEAAVRSVKGRLVGEATVGELARRDYEVRVAKCGLHEDVVIGDSSVPNLLFE